MWTDISQRALISCACVHAWFSLCAPHVRRCLQRTEGAVRPPGTGVTGTCELPDEGAGNPTLTRGVECMKEGQPHCTFSIH